MCFHSCRLHACAGAPLSLAHSLSAAQIVPEQLGLGVPLTDENVSAKAFELIFAFDEVLEHLPMRFDVLVEVHRQEAGELQEAGVNLAHEARIAERHPVDDVAFEPVEVMALGERIHRRRAFARVDRPAD